MPAHNYLTVRDTDVYSNRVRTALEAYKHVVEFMRVSNTSKLFARSVDLQYHFAVMGEGENGPFARTHPVAALSTMTSASSGGRDSVAPYALKKVHCRKVDVGPSAYSYYKTNVIALRCQPLPCQTFIF
jgi:hypothetical protein